MSPGHRSKSRRHSPAKETTYGSDVLPDVVYDIVYVTFPDGSGRHVGTTYEAVPVLVPVPVGTTLQGGSEMVDMLGKMNCAGGGPVLADCKVDCCRRCRHVDASGD